MGRGDPRPAPTRKAWASGCGPRRTRRLAVSGPVGGGRRAEPQGRQAERGGTDRGGQDGKRHPAGRPLLRQVGQRPRAPSREPRPRPPPPNNGDRAGGVAGRGGWGKLRDKGPRRGRGADSPPGGRVASRHGVGAGGAQACLRVGSRVKLLWSPPPKSDERLAK